MSSYLTYFCIIKHTEYTCALVNVYLPPENSVYGDDPMGMFQHLLSNMFELCEMDLIIMGEISMPDWET